MNNRNVTIILLLLLGLTFMAKSSNSRVDSLQTLIANEHDSLRVHHLFELGKILSNKNLDDGIPPLEQAYELAGKLYEKELQAEINYELAGIYWYKGLNYKAMQLDRTTLEIYESLNDTAGMGKTLMGIGVSYYALGLDEAAMSNFTNALEYARISKNKELQIKTYLNMSALVASMGKMELSHSYVNKGLELSGVGDEFEKTKAILLVNKSSYFSNIGDKEKSLELLKMAKEIFETNNMTSHFISSSMNIIDFQFDIADYDKASMILEIDELCKKSLDFGDYPGLVSGLRIWSKMLIDIDEYYAAEMILDSMSNLSQAMGLTDGYLSSLEDKSEIYRETGRLTASIKTLEEYIAMTDSISEATNDARLNKVMSFLEMDRKNAEIDGLKEQMSDDMLIDDQKSMILTLLSVLVFFLLGVSLYVFKNMKTIDAQKKKLKRDNGRIGQVNKRLNEQKILLGELNEKLKYEKAVATQATKSKANFLSTMSHELRTPLNGILGISKVMQGTDMNKVEVRDNLDILDFSANNLLTLINDILDYSKLDEKKVDLERKEENLPVYIEKLVKSIRISAEDKGLELKTDISKEIPAIVNCDITRINQVMNNLLNNAIKFTHEGSVTIGVNVLKKNKKEVKLRFSVRDTGIGISKENTSNVFERFAQAEASTTRKFGGSGLGLSICKSLVELMDSSLELDSELNKGSFFYFDITLDIVSNSKSKSKDSAVDKKPIAEEEWKLLNVLVVDDNEINRTVIGGMLGLYGINVGYAENGEVAVKAVREGDYNCVLMDIQMPVMDGFDATLLIRDSHPELSVIALTAGGFDEFSNDERSAEFTGFLRKPVVIEKILEVLEQTLLSVKENAVG